MCLKVTDLENIVSMNTEQSVDDDDSKKEELSSIHVPFEVPTTQYLQNLKIIALYNETKGSVNIVDHMKEEYFVGRMTRRWPMKLFFH